MKSFMSLALEQAKVAYQADEVPVGAVVVKDNQVIATGYNQVITLQDPSAHAEIIALRAAARLLQSEFLVGCDLYVTLEPCPMCAFALSLARINRLYFGAYDAKMGGVEHGPKVLRSTSCHHQIEVYGGIREDECSSMLKSFFAGKR
jgi:tRNA(Arg) A34 adenosine deaminase TadA